jgi:hypothetical protein
MKFNRDKFQRLVQYICHKAPPEKFGSVKLNKILWFSEKYWYDNNGETATGAVFIKKGHGPVASPLVVTLDTMIKKGLVKITKGKDGEPTKFRCKHEPDMSDFDAKFLEAVNAFTYIICTKYTSVTISALSHDKLWINSKDGDVLPFAAYSSSDDITEEEWAWAETCPA